MTPNATSTRQTFKPLPKGMNAVMATWCGHRQRLSMILVTIANLLLPLSIFVFGIGFFPYKPFLPGLARYETLAYGDPPKAPFDKLVFMVVDALRRSIWIAQERQAVSASEWLILS